MVIRGVVLATLVVLAGCATAPGADTRDSRAFTNEPNDERTNPWGTEPIVVTVNNTANDSRSFAPVVREALAYWEQNSPQYVGYSVTYELVENAKEKKDEYIDNAKEKTQSKIDEVASKAETEIDEKVEPS